MSAPGWIAEAIGRWRPLAREDALTLHARGLFSLYRLETRDGVFAVKQVASEQMACAEAAGLQTLAAAGASAPAVLKAVALDAKRAVLIMEFLNGRNGLDRRPLVRDLIRLYSTGSAQYGLEIDNFCGPLLQKNQPRATFQEFWIENRIAAQLSLAQQSGALAAADCSTIEQAVRKAIDRWLLNEVPPRLIHGDLWSGNLLAHNGRAYLIDPSVAYSNPEQDLAMLQLFGSPLSVADIDEICAGAGLAAGFWERLGFWQTYPLLVHLNLFGSAYLAQLRRAISSFA